MNTEYIAYYKAAKNTAGIKQQLAKLNVIINQPPLLLTDSKGVMKLLKTVKFHQKSQYAKQQFYYL
jgi:predicted transport protein